MPLPSNAEGPGYPDQDNRDQNDFILLDSSGGKLKIYCYGSTRHGTRR